MTRTKRCKHRRLSPRCKSCSALQAKWYAKLRETDFKDIEYGLDSPRFIRGNVDPSQPGADEANEYYEKVWQIFHFWSASGRSLRDCRIAELLAEQDGNTGTVRGISRILHAENLSPWGTGSIQRTIREIRDIVLKTKRQPSIIPIVYIKVRHKAA